MNDRGAQSAAENDLLPRPCVVTGQTGSDRSAHNWRNSDADMVAEHECNLELFPSFIQLLSLPLLLLSYSLCIDFGLLQRQLHTH